MNSLPIHIQYRHVEGHQSTKYPIRQLDAWAELNEHMDALAKAYLDYSQEHPTISHELTHDEWHISLEGNKICRKMKVELDRYLRTRQIILLWTNSQKRAGQTTAPKFTSLQVSTVNIQKCWATQRGCIQRFLCKMTTNQLATGRYMKRMRFWPSVNRSKQVDNQF